MHAALGCDIGCIKFQKINILTQAWPKPKQKNYLITKNQKKNKKFLKHALKTQK